MVVRCALQALGVQAPPGLQSAGLQAPPGLQSAGEQVAVLTRSGLMDLNLPPLSLPPAKAKVEAASRLAKNRLVIWGGEIEVDEK